jgi:hypothetical protein
MAISFSQIDRIVKPRVGLRRRADRADQRADLTISKNKEKEKGTTNLWMQAHDCSPGHPGREVHSRLPDGFHWSRDGKTMAVLRRRSASDVVAESG